MAPSLRALLTNIIDYAGMFPPAQLPMDEAIRNYARYRTEPESWMLGRFICPAARLNELSPYVEDLFRDGPPLAISALGRGGDDEESLMEGLKQDLADISSFSVRWAGRVIVDVIETKLLPTTGRIIFTAAKSIQENPKLKVYFEQSHPHAVRPMFRGSSQIGFKMRCGGAAATAVPTPDEMARLIMDCRQNDTPLKFTAGLHHPFRHFDSSIEAKMHGFINVFSAGVIAQTGLGQWQLAVKWILEDEDPAHFRFNDDDMSWRDLRATIPQIESARRNNVISFGSCSFDEPREDLKALGWL